MIITIGSKVKDGEGNTYTLTEELGHGGFGCVYKAECEADKSVYAVKTLLYSFGDEVTAASFKNEVKISSEVSGEHVIHYIYAHDGDEYPELPPYIIMEYAEGGTLADQIEERKKTNSPYSKEELRNLFLQLVDGMKSINKKLVHRDIKPENILICNGICKITDFGLAKVASESTRTMSFKGYGTLQYIAPEAWKSEKNTIQMDIYSMGIVFYELALLDYPYDIISNDVDAYRSAHMFSRIKRTNDLKNVLGADVASIILAMLEKPVQKRLKSWEEIEEQLGNPSLEVNGDLGNIVSLAIGKKIETDTRIQQQIEEENRKRKEKEDFCNLVRNQFESVIVDFFEQFTDEYNIHLAGNDKCRLQSTSRGYGHIEQFSYQLTIPSVTNIEVKCKVILPNSFTRIVDVDRAYGFSYMYGSVYGKREVVYTPQYKNKDIMGWVEIKNTKGLGFNLWLIQTDDMYGDWYVLRNKNNGIYATQYEPKQEPFAFEIDELDEALKGINAFSLYSSEVEPFDKAHTTSDGNKQFSAVGDELIMGRWLKGRLAAAGLVNPVNDTQADTEREGMITKEMLEEYGCENLYLKKTGQTAMDEDGTPLDVWMLSFKPTDEEGDEE